MKKKKFILAIAVLISCLFLVQKNTLATEVEYVTGIGIIAPENGAGNTFIKSADIEAKQPDGSYVTDAVIYYANTLPETIEVSLENIISGQCFIIYNDIEYRYTGTRISLGVNSPSLSFSVSVTSNTGLSLQKIHVTVGLVKVDGKSFFDSKVSGASPLGTAESPFVINKPVHLDNMRMFLNSNFELGSDINLANYYCKMNEFSPSAASNRNWRSIGYSDTYYFSGNINGNSHKISNLTLNNYSFFEYTKNSSVSNLTFENANLVANSKASAILATNASNLKVSNVNLSGTITSSVNEVAALICKADYSAINSTDASKRTVIDGINSNVKLTNSNNRSFAGIIYNFAGAADLVDEIRPIIKNVRVEADFSVGSSSGGILGIASNVIIADSTVSGKMNARANADYVGGFIANATNAAINNSEAKLEISASNALSYTGGFVGYANNNISFGADTKFQGAIAAYGNYIGSLVGSVNGNLVIGKDLEITLTHIYAISYAGGIAGSVSGKLEIAENAKIEIASIISTGSYIGGLAGSVNNDIMVGENLALDLNLLEASGDFIGGVFGATNKKVTLSANTSINISGISGRNYVGGFVGNASYTLDNSDSYKLENDLVLKIGAVKGVQRVGGFAGMFTGQIDELTLSNIIVYSSSTGDGRVGGFAGMFTGKVVNVTLNNLTVTSAAAAANSRVGGFAGEFNGNFHNIVINNANVSSKGEHTGGFAGYFTGSGDKISILASVEGRTQYGGFAGRIIANANIINGITIKEGTILRASSGGNYVGGVAGYVESGTISDVVIEKGLKLNLPGSSYVGGVFGTMQNSQLDNVEIYADINALSYIGGVVGSMNTAKIGSNNIAYVTINSPNNSYPNVGGFVATMTSSQIENNNAVIGNLKASNSPGGFGGFAYTADANSTIGENNSFQGSITAGGYNIGGFVAVNRANIGAGTYVDVQIYFTSTAVEHAGFLIGAQFDGTIRNFTISEASKFHDAVGTYMGVIGLIYDGTIGGTESNPLVLSKSMTSLGNSLPVGALAPSLRNGKIENVIVEATVTSLFGGPAGALLGQVESNFVGGSFRNITVSASASVIVDTGTAGGLIGHAGFDNRYKDLDRFENCITYNTVFARSGTIGGFAGALVNARFVGENKSYSTVKLFGGATGTFGGFAGAINGGNYSGVEVYGDVIADIYYASGSTPPIGGFAGTIGANTEIKDVKAYGSVISYYGMIGGFVGANNGTIENCTAYGDLIYSKYNVPAGGSNQPSYTGGFVGEMINGYIDASTCKYVPNFISGSYVGGFVGRMRGGLIDGGKDNAVVEINTNVTGVAGAGGFVYQLGNEDAPQAIGTIKNIRYNGNVISTVGYLSGEAGTGGFIGYFAAGIIYNCSTTSSVTVTAYNSYVGGFAGSISPRTNVPTGFEKVKLINCASESHVLDLNTAGSRSGALYGYITNINLINSDINTINTWTENVTRSTIIISLRHQQDSSNITDTLKYLLGTSVDLEYTITGATNQTATYEVISGSAEISNNSGNAFSLEFTQSGAVVLRIKSDENTAVYRDYAFYVYLPESNTITTNLNFAAWYDDDTDLTFDMPAEFSSFLEIQLNYNGKWITADSENIKNSGSYSVKVRYLETKTNKVTAEYIVGTLKVDKTDINDCLSYYSYLTADSIVFSLVWLAPFDKNLPLSGVKYSYSIDGATAKPLTDILNFAVSITDAEQTIEFFAETGTGKTASISSITIPAKEQPLVVNLTVSSTYKFGSWTKNDVLIYLLVDVNVSNLRYFYRINPSTSWQEMQSTFLLQITNSVDAVYNFKVTDASGNDLDVTTEGYEVKIDKTNVVINAENMPGSDELITESFMAIMKINSLPLSGITSILLNDVEIFDPVNVNGNSYEHAFEVKNNGNYKIVLIDGSKREFTFSHTVNSFKVGDISDFAIVGEITKAYVDKIILEFTTSSENIKSFEYSNNGILFYPIATYPNYTITKNATYWFKLTDTSGKEKIISDIVIDNIDDFQPILYLDYNGSAWSIGGEPIKITPIVGGSGIKSITVRLNNDEEKTLPVDATEYKVFERGIYYFTLTANSGASVTQSVKVILIDNHTEVTLAVDVDDPNKLDKWISDSITFTLSVVQDVTVSLKYFYSTDDGANWNSINGKVLTVSKNTMAKYIFRVVTATNISDTSDEYSVKIDSERPNIIIDSKWDINGTDNKVTYTVTSSNTYCDYSVEYKNINDSTWQLLTDNNGRSVTLNVPELNPENYQFRVKSILNNETISGLVPVVNDKIQPALKVDFDNRTSNANDWSDYIIFILSNTAIQHSGTKYEYRIIYSDRATDWTPVNGSTLTINYSIIADIEFRAISGTGIKSDESQHLTFPLRIDATAEVKVTDSGTGFTDKDVQLDVEFKAGGSGLANMYIILPSGAILTPSGNISITASENGLYRFYVENRIGYFNEFSYEVKRIDKEAPQFTVDVTGDVGSWTNKPISIRFLPLNSPLSKIYFQYSNDNGANWFDVDNKNRLDLTEDTNGVIQLRAITGSGIIANYFQPLEIMIDNAEPIINVKINENVDKLSYIQFSISTIFGQSSGQVFVNYNGIVSILENDLFDAKLDGTYIFYAKSVTGILSENKIFNLVSPAIRGVIKGADYTLANLNDKTFKNNVKILGNDYNSIKVFKDLKEVEIEFKNGEYTFNKNGNYLIQFVGESGNIIEVSFIVNKPNYALYGTISALVIIFTVTICILTVSNVKNKRALKRLIAVSSISDASNKFGLFNKIK